ncbi:hypothetical protein [Marinobacter sp. ELB17]|uniref:hypothetical protein n=1 Tax=Marinobacter sp. ELB17 TaxID=270374 RepID=UPI001D0D1CB6|nr:hypothetical protein [Marinobacter sp. ELB17]
MKSTRLGRAIRLATLAAIAAPATVFAGGFPLTSRVPARWAWRMRVRQQIRRTHPRRFLTRRV